MAQLMADKGALLSVCTRAVAGEILDLGRIPKQQVDALLWLFEKIDGMKSDVEGSKVVPLSTGRAFYYLARAVELHLLGQALTDEMLDKLIRHEVETVEKIEERAITDRDLNPECALVEAVPCIKGAASLLSAAVASVRSLSRQLVVALAGDAHDIESSPTVAVKFQELVINRFSEVSDGSQESISAAKADTHPNDEPAAEPVGVEKPQEGGKDSDAETADATRNLALQFSREYSGFACGVDLELRSNGVDFELARGSIEVDPDIVAATETADAPAASPNGSGAEEATDAPSLHHAGRQDSLVWNCAQQVWQLCVKELELLLAGARRLSEEIRSMETRGLEAVAAARVIKEAARSAQSLVETQTPVRNPTTSAAFARVRLGTAKRTKGELEEKLQRLEDTRCAASVDAESAREAVLGMDALLAEAPEDPQHRALIAECRGPVDAELATAERKQEEAAVAVQNTEAQLVTANAEVAKYEAEVDALLQVPQVSQAQVAANKTRAAAKKIELGMHLKRIEGQRKKLFDKQEDLRKSMMKLMRTHKCSVDEFDQAIAADIPHVSGDLSATASTAKSSSHSAAAGTPSVSFAASRQEPRPSPSREPLRTASTAKADALGCRRPTASPVKMVPQQPSTPSGRPQIESEKQSASAVRRPQAAVVAFTAAGRQVGNTPQAQKSSKSAEVDPKGSSAAVITQDVRAAGKTDNVRAVVSELHAASASGTPVAGRARGKGKVTKGAGAAAAKGVEAQEELPWGLEEYKALLDSTYSCEQPFAPAFNPVVLGNTARAVQNPRTRDVRTDTLANVNYRMVSPEHAAVLIPILEMLIIRAKVRDEDLWANRNKTQAGRKRARKEGVTEKHRYYRGDAFLILQSYFRYLREELQIFDSQFFFPDTRLIYKFTRMRRGELTKMGYPKLSMTGIQRLLLQFDAIALYQPNDNSRYGIARTDAAVKKPEHLFESIMHWDELDVDSQRLIDAVTTKTAAEAPYQPLLAKLVARLHAIEPRLQLTLTARLEEALRNKEEADCASLVSADASDEDAVTDLSGDDEPVSKRSAQNKLPSSVYYDTDSDTIVLRENQPTIDADLGLPWVSFSDGSTEAPERTIERVKNNVEFGQADKDNCGIISGDTTRHGISPVMGTSSKAPHLMQALSQRIEKALGRQVDVQPIFVSHSQYMGPTCASERAETKTQQVVDVGDGKRAFVLVLCRDGHGNNCATRYVVLGVYLPNYVSQDESEQILDFLSNDVFHGCEDTQARWMLAPNLTDLCGCEGVADSNDLHIARCAHVKVFGCISRMDRSIRPAVRRCHFFKTAPMGKMRFGGQGAGPEMDPEYGAHNNEILERLNNLATTFAPLLKNISPIAYQNQMLFSGIASSCRIGNPPEGSPFAAMTIGFDAAEHFHCAHEMTNGATVKIFLVDSEAAAAEEKRGGKGSAGFVSDQKLIFPELVVRNTPTRADPGARPGLAFPVLNGAVFIGPLSHLYHGLSAVDRHVSCYVGTAVVTLGQASALHVANHGVGN